MNEQCGLRKGNGKGTCHAASGMKAHFNELMLDFWAQRSVRNSSTITAYLQCNQCTLNVHAPNVYPPKPFP